MQRITRPKNLRLLVAVAAIAGLMVVPATGQSAFKFGSKLTTEMQPSNAGSGHYCVEDDHPQKCSWVMNDARGRPNGGEKSPKNGTIKKIRLIAQVGGSFQLQIVQAKKAGNDWKAKVVRKGPVIHFDGQPDPDEPYLIESFNVNIPIKKGQRLAIKTNRTSLLQCSSGGDNTLLYEPPLVKGKPFRKNTDDSGCWMLIEAVANPASARVGGTLRSTHN